MNSTGFWGHEEGCQTSQVKCFFGGGGRAACPHGGVAKDGQLFAGERAKKEVGGLAGWLILRSKSLYDSK